MKTGLEVRVEMLEQTVARLDELVDGQEPWSHRKRLHDLEDNDRGVALAAQALQAYKTTRASTSARVREWGAFALAAVALFRPWDWW